MNYYYHEIPATPKKRSEKELEKREKLICLTAEWIIQQVCENLSKDSYAPELKNFKEHIIVALEECFRRIGCANLRTYTSNASLVELAKLCSIPVGSLPKKISIVVTYDCAYFCESSSPIKRTIAS